MINVTHEELQRMNADSERCARELADAGVNVLAHACLVATMTMGLGAHKAMEQTLVAAMAQEGLTAPAISSAGALIRTLKRLRAKRIAFVAPYLPALTKVVSNYFSSEGFEVVNYIALGVQNNLDVANLDQTELTDHVLKLEVDGVDTVIASACVQMPSILAMKSLNLKMKTPIISASLCTALEIAAALNVSSVGQSAEELITQMIKLS
jgi:maleate isomerase